MIWHIFGWQNCTLPFRTFSNFERNFFRNDVFYHLRKYVQNVGACVVHIYNSKNSPLIYRDKKWRFFKAFFAAFLIFGYFLEEIVVNHNHLALQYTAFVYIAVNNINLF